MTTGLTLPQIIDSIADLFFPLSCVFCSSNTLVSRDLRLCRECAELLPLIRPPICSRCGVPLHGVPEESEIECGLCQIDPPAYRRARYALKYKAEVRRALVGFKYASALHIGPTLGYLLMETFRRHFLPEEFDVVIPVPMSKGRLILRGFNQAAILSRKVSLSTGIPLDLSSFRKVRNTPRQVGLPRAKRLTNLAGAFS
ncbi:MAG: double zinc ribbon domain-containing protein, partial [Pseudomonadota bacterium]